MFLARFSLIVAIDAKNGISKNGCIPWHSPQDLKFFKDITMGHPVIMGRKTYESIPEKFRPLKGRKNIVISTSYRQKDHPDLLITPSLEASLISVKPTEEPFIIGGEGIYDQAIRKYLYLCDRIYVTKFLKDYNCDQFFPFDLIAGFPVEKIEQTACMKTGEDDEFVRYIFSPKVKHEEYQYLELLERVLQNGDMKEDRTQVGTLSIFGERMMFDITDTIPVLTTKKVFYSGVIKELLFFLSGKTDTTILEKQGVKIWMGNTRKEFLEKRGLPYREGDMGPCFVTGTPVLTLEGYKFIEDVKVNDILYTHVGRWRPITEIHKRSYTGCMIHLDVKYHPSLIECTPEHPFYARKFIIKDQQNIVADPPEWVNANNLTSNHLLGFKIETIEEIPSLNLTQYINQHCDAKSYIKRIDKPEEWFMLGYFLENGWISEEANGPWIHFVMWKSQQDNILTKLRMVLNLQLKSEQSTYSTYWCYDTEWSQILLQFGKYTHCKLIPDWVHRAPVEMLHQFLDGYCYTDGCIKMMSNKECRNYTTMSLDIALSIQRIYLKLGKFAGISFQKGDYQKMLEDRIINQQDCYLIRVYEDSKRKCKYCYIENGYAWFTIISIQRVAVQDVTVYNFTVHEDNTYTIKNLTVHNCYGFQWRHWGAEYTGCDTDYKDKGVDQIKSLVEGIRKDPLSRRHILTAWNVAEIDKMTLPPCHMMAQFNVSGNKKYLDCSVYLRSNDLFLGAPFNIASYAILTYMIAHVTGLKPRNLIYVMGDAHVYLNHKEQVFQQLQRTPKPFPQLLFKDPEKLKEIDDFTYDSFILKDYSSWPTITAEMAI